MDQETPSRADLEAEIKRSKSWDQIVTEGDKGSGKERILLVCLIGAFVVAGIIAMALFHTI